MKGRTVRVVISGQVQGVSYRLWTVGLARSMGINGWVRNLSDGTVEAVFSGLTADVEAMIQACHEGPPAAKVDTVHVRDEGVTPSSGFMKKPTL